MKNIVKGSSKGQTALRAFSVGTVMAVVLCMMFSIFMLPMQAQADDYGKQAQEQWSRPGYANEMMSGDPSNRGGWSTDVYSEISDANPSSSGEDFVAKFNNISNTIATDLAWIVGIVLVIRFLLRAMFEMAFRQKNGTYDPAFMDKHSLLVGFISTGDERKSQKLNSNWVAPMIKSTLLIVLVVLGIWILLRIIAGIVVYAINASEVKELLATK